MTELVAALYILGAALTIYGVTAAYLRAKKQKADYDAVKVRSDQLEDPTFTDFHEAGRGEDETAAPNLKAQVDRNQDEISNLLASVGVTDPPPSWEDMRFPAEYWSRRAALSEALLVFKTDGLLALSGVVISTVASVMSLYI